jgi:hypothetical protein
VSERVDTVRTEFTAEDRGLAAHQLRYSDLFEKGAHKLEGFKERLSEFRREQGLTTVAALGLGYGIGSWLEKAKEVNAEFGRAKKGIAGVLAGALEFPKGTAEIERYTKSLKSAGEVTELVEDTAARFNLQFEDTATVYKKLALAAGGLGLTQKQVNDLMVSTSATAARFQVSGETAANTVARAMKTGAVRGVDEFSISLGRAIGNMRKLNQEQRFEHIQRALQGSTQIADAMASGLTGTLTRIRNEVGKTFREITSPVFGEVAKRLESWGKHLREARDNGKPLIEEISGKLLSAFNGIADAVGTIREHWVAIAAVMAGMKLNQLASGLASSAAAMGAADAGIGGLGARGVAGGAGAIAKIARLSVVAEAAYFAGGAIGELLGKKFIDDGMTEHRRASDIAGKLAIAGAMAKGGAGQQFSESQVAKARGAIESLAKLGVVTKDPTGRYGVNRDALGREYGRMGAYLEGGNLGKYYDLAGAARAAAPAKAAADAISAQLTNLFAMVGPAVVAKVGGAEDENRKFAKKVINNNFNGGIHVTWKNEETDPDRAFVRFVDSIEGYTHRPTQARTSEALGD